MESWTLYTTRGIDYSLMMSVMCSQHLQGHCVARHRVTFKRWGKFVITKYKFAFIFLYFYLL